MISEDDLERMRDFDANIESEEDIAKISSDDIIWMNCFLHEVLDENTKLKEDIKLYHFLVESLNQSKTLKSEIERLENRITELLVNQTPR